MENKIKFIKAYVRDGFYEKADVQYEDDSILPVEGFGNIVDIISKFSMQELKIVEELKNDPNKMVIEELKKEKYNVKVVTSLVIASVLLTTGIGTYHLVKHSNKNKDNGKIKNDKEVIEVTNTPIPTLKPTQTLRPIDTSLPSIVKVDTGTKIEENGSKYIENLENNYVNIDVTCQRIRDYLDGTDRGELAFNEIINAISNECYSNMFQLMNVTYGKRMTGDKYLLTLYNSFDQETTDYKVLNYFIEKRNSIIDNAFNYQNIDRTKKDIYKFLDELTNFIFKKRSIYISESNTRLYYKGLNDITTLILSDLDLFMLYTDVDYVIKIDGREWNKSKIAEELQKLINKSCNNLEKLIDRQYVKK